MMLDEKSKLLEVKVDIYSSYLVSLRFLPGHVLPRASPTSEGYLPRRERATWCSRATSHTAGVMPNHAHIPSHPTQKHLSQEP